MNNGSRIPQQASSPLRLLLILGFSIFGIELLIMSLFRYLHPQSDLVQALLDSVLLVGLSFPVLYFFVFRRLLLEITERKYAEAAQKNVLSELELTNNRLEDVIARANELAAQALLNEERLEELSARYWAVTQSATDAIISADAAGAITGWNHGAEVIFGYIVPEVTGQPLTMLMPSSYQQSHLAGMERVNSGGEKHMIGKTLEAEAQRKDGSIFPMEVSLAEWQVNHTKFYTAIIRDITERKRLEIELQKQARMDGLTGAANRRYLLELANVEIKRAIRMNRPLAIALFDIDHFKFVNDSYGHAAGDHALMLLTKICTQNVREIDKFARFGGDEFALLLFETSSEQAFMVVERIRLAVMSSPFDFGGRMISLTISAGIADLSADDDTFDIILSRADNALYQAKESGRNRVVVNLLV